ncbi:hypothetical protein TNCT_345801 [Trichonephila clavata]|uniref:Uncharacterized protein n=1 Tax=Trichonephila clavata TaxID=2740835 RepID=A0A8X6K8V8_TRICU|nr:hypothetical protein TNCT_345801 [Trichonephila clavata]
MSLKSLKKKPSGAEFRKRAAENQQNEEKELKKVSKKSFFFFKSFIMLKSLSETRWSERADVLRAQVTSRNKIKNALEDLIEDNTQTPDTRVIA